MTNWPPLFHASTPSNPLYKLTKLWTPSLFHNWYWSRGTNVRLSASGVLLKALWQLRCRYLVHQGGDCCSSASGQRTVCILVSYVSFSLSWVRGSTYLCNNNLCKTSHASSSYMIRHRSCLYFKKNIRLSAFSGGSGQGLCRFILSDSTASYSVSVHSLFFWTGSKVLGTNNSMFYIHDDSKVFMVFLPMQIFKEKNIFSVPTHSDHKLQQRCNSLTNLKIA
jgi:hypothetical protein